MSVRSIARTDAATYWLLEQQDRSERKIYAHLLSEYCGVRREGADVSNLKIVVTQTISHSVERQLEWIVFLGYAMRPYVISDPGTRSLVKELYDDVVRVAKMDEAAKVAEL
jgi:hypothetical protein